MEIGVGTGKNLPYYNTKTEVTGIDLSPSMLNKAKVCTKKLGLKSRLLQVDAQKLKFKNNSFDYVIGSFVLCSIPNSVSPKRD